MLSRLLNINSYVKYILIAILSFGSISAQVTYTEAFPGIKFTYPVELQNSNDGTNRMFVVEQEGRIKVFDITSNVSSSDVKTFLDITDRVSFSNGQEIGLLGLAFHPNYSINGYFYVYYTTNSPISGISTRIVLSRFSVNSSNINVADKNTELVLFQFDKNQSNSNHNGGKIAFGPNNYLYISVGDGGGGNDPKVNGQNINTIFGSICRIDVDLDNSNPIETNPILPDGNYEIPTDNPFVGVNGLDEIYAYGIRNTWKFSYDNITGRLWGADVGQGNFEEINLIENGNNYGWSRFEGTSIANNSVIITETTTFPIHIYDHSQGNISITGGYVYRGSEITSTTPSINTKYIFGDYVSGRVWALDYNQSSNTSSSTLLFKTNGQSISSFGKDEAGELYFSDYRGGDAEIYKLVDGTTGSSGTIVSGKGSWESLAQGINGIVEDIAVDANNNVYFGGEFSQAGNISANNIAMWNRTNGWQALGTGTNGTINALKVDVNENLYVGGSFTTANGINALNIAKWNGAQWSALGLGIDGVVASLEIDANNNLYAGGIFNAINGTTANNIGYWNGSEWSVLTDNTSGIAGTNNEIRSLVIDDNDGILYVGGNFDQAGGKTANRIALWDGNNWGTLGAGTSGFVEAIAITSTDIYTGGNFINAGGITANRIAKWNKSSSVWSPLSSGVNNTISSLLHDGTFLYAGGTFDIAFNTSQNGIIVNNIARWSVANNWESLGTNTDVGVDININTMVFSADSVDKIYVGGNFTKAGAIDVNNTALWLSENALSISEYINTDEVYIYPNPTEGVFKISIDTDWVIFSSTGKIITKGKGTTINVSKVAKGLYFLKTITGNIFKVVKR